MIKSSRLRPRSRRLETRKRVDLESGIHSGESTGAAGVCIFVLVMAKNEFPIDVVEENGMI
jgi:riboflavin synthase alpha subunit